MKSFWMRLFFAISLGLGLTMTMAAQTASTTAEPEWSGIVYQLSTDGKLMPLEKGKTVVQAKMRGFGFGGAEEWVSFTGEKSPIRCISTASFVIRLDGINGDPSTLVNIDHLTLKKGMRSLMLAKTSMLKTKKLPESGVELTFKRYGEHSLEFTPATPLQTGEYIISTSSNNNVVYLFGVD